MSKEELLAGILQLAPKERESLIHEAIESLPQDYVIESSMSAELRALLEGRYQDMVEHPDEDMSWEEVCAQLDERKARRQKRTVA